MFKKITMAVMATALMLGIGVVPAARAATDQQELVDRATITVSDLKKDPAFGNAQQLIRTARAVLIIPQLFKGGFFVGGEGGNGVLLTRRGRGWSNPAFYSMFSASFGLQIGAQTSELILIVRTEKGLNSLMHDQLKIGVQAGLAIVTLGSSAEAATTPAVGADIVVWASSTGAYAGLTLNGSVIKPKWDWDQAYYGRRLNSVDIVSRNLVTNPGADRLKADLASVSNR
ncbi:MAG TPA: lipid-binding SYLF domain-containing protein [Stellaceae bacterium]|jgi:lipid-binding SYLF domain-containing protein|nr:lipid-binding SYLF domain-containing protein [Stellaceae bacterium]